MRKWILLAGTLLVLPVMAKAQWFIEPLTGYQQDLSNHGRFPLFDLGLQATLDRSRKYELIIRLQHGIGFSQHGIDSSFTSNPALPLYAAAHKTLLPSAGYLSFDQRFKFRTRRPGHQFSVLLLLGINTQKVTVNYQYDKANYTVLNPDVTEKMSRLCVGTGVEYMRVLKNSRMFVQLTLSSHPGGMSWVPSSFSPMAPLAINFGYSVPLKRKNHEE